MDFSEEVSKVYDVITDGIYDSMEVSAEDVLQEFDFCYGNIARMAIELEEKMDVVFANCKTVEDCKDAIIEYFAWDRY